MDLKWEKMKDYIKFKIDMEINAAKIIQQVEIHNRNVEDVVEAAVTRAITECSAFKAKKLTRKR